jgi:hypothetical protein
MRPFRSRQHFIAVVIILFTASLAFLLFGTEIGTSVVRHAANVIEHLPGTSKEDEPKGPPHPIYKPTPTYTPPPVTEHLPGTSKEDEPKGPPHPIYKPTPTYTPPPVKDPFPLLATSTPPPIPKHNVPKKNVHKNYGLKLAPPLLIGFTRSWPMLLQSVVSYITAGWPADMIYVVENTGVQMSNAKGLLSLQHPFYLNHTSLKRLGVNVIQTPVLLTFAQLQNFYLSLASQNDWPFYFWSHMDVLVLSFEDGWEEGPKVGEPGYKTIYELACVAVNHTITTDSRWATRLFAYDYLTLVNPAAFDEVGAWDTLIPYYMTDCDMYSRLTMANLSQHNMRVGIISDVATTLDDLHALYRDPSVQPSWSDPNPPPPESEENAKRKRDLSDPLEYWQVLKDISNQMDYSKQGDRGRNTWQRGQRGGWGEPYYYDAEGFIEALDVITEAGKEVFRRKWGHRDCDLISTGLALGDQWRLEKDWD